MYGLRLPTPCGPTGLFEEVKALKNLRISDLLVVAVSLALTTTLVSLVESQGALKSKVLPVLSSSDVIGYTTPCG